MKPWVYFVNSVGFAVLAGIGINLSRQGLPARMMVVLGIIGGLACLWMGFDARRKRPK
jgi:hypothetical protein